MSVWIQNLLSAIEHREAIILHGNVRDRYIDPQKNRIYENLTDLIPDLWKFEKKKIIRYDRVSRQQTVIDSSGKQQDVDPDGEENPERTLTIWWKEHLMSSLEGNTLTIIFFLDKLIPFKNTYSDEEMRLILLLEKIIGDITPNNRLIMVALRDTMVPIELYTHSPKTAVIPIPVPDKEDRQAYLKHFLDSHEDSNLITDLTDGLYLRDLDVITSEIKKNPDMGNTEIKQLINKYRIGEQEDYWGKLNIQKIDYAFDEFTDDKGVKGQDEAVRRIIDTIRLARAGLSGMSSGTVSKPKVVFFFAGPTGVGKTFLAKNLAEWLFGSKDAFIRFDMSEFKEEHTISKFIGSPPGYVGYERGGLLTNAVKEKPFSIILFDEIEKAHPKIMDMFLQILDDGRLTDSRGQTIFFTETVIIFTSNIGTRSSNSKGEPITEKDRIGDILKEQGDENVLKERVHNHFRSAVEQFFIEEISRPELLNRIGNNIIPFNYINNTEIQKEIVRSNMKRISGDFEDRFKSKGYKLSFSDSVVDFLIAKNSKKIAEFGGRAVTTSIEDEVMMQLARKVLVAEDKNADNIPFSVNIVNDRIHVEYPKQE